MKTYSIYRLGVKKHDFVIEDDDIRRSMSHDNNVSFNVESKDSLDIKIGDYIIEDGSHYTIYDPIDVEESNGVFSYHLVFRSPDYKLKFSIVKDEGATTFPYHGGIKEFVDLVILSLNEDQQEYTAGDIDEGNIIDLEFDNSSCFQALDDICEAANMEWNLTGTSINVKYRIGKDVDIVFEYGKEKGGYSVRLDKVQNTSIVTRLIGKGGTINLPKDYVSPDTPKRLNLGNEILEKNIDKYGKITGVYTNDNIYPRLINKTVLEVTIPEDIEKATSWKLKLDLPFDLSQQYADDKTPLIKFQTGDLTGNEFEIVDNSWNNTDKTLEIIVQEDESDGYKLPNETRQPRVGDVFVLLNIYMPQSYVDEAIDELRTATQEELNKKSEPQYAPTVKVSKRFLTKNGYSLDIGDSITVKVGEHSINTRILAINQSSSSDEINYELGDEILYSYEDNVNNQIEQIQVTLKQLISLEDVRRLFNVLINQWRPLWMDQKLHSYDDVRFKSVTQTDDNWHITDKGDVKLRDIIGRVITITDRLMTDNFVAGMTGTGVGVVNKAEVHMDKGVIRKYLEVLALVVAQIFYRGGRQVLSPAGMKINRVEEFDGYWRCYMETEDGQVNQFTVGAQARCNRYGSRQRYWWRLVEAIGVDYIDVSKTDMDAGSMAPAVGDEVVQFGHRTDPYLQWVVMDSSFSDDAGRTIYAGVNSYDLSGKWVLREGVSPTDPSRIGLFTKHGEFSDVIEGLNQDIEDTKKEAQDAASDVKKVQDVVDNITGIILPDVYKQLDGAIQSWDGEVEPTLNNYPANEWTTDEERSKHVGDTYLYYTTASDGSKVASRYNFRFVDGVYKWERVNDSVSAELENDLRELTGTVGKKNSITYSDNVPSPAYNIDDLWIKMNGSMYICRAQKMEGMQGSAADWELFNDTMLRLVQIASDNVISVEEKPSLRDDWSRIQKEFVKYQSDAASYGVSITNLQNAYNALNAFLTDTVKLSQDVDTALTVSQKADYNQKFADYYSRRTEFANIVSQKIADGAVGNIQFGMVNLLKGSNVELGAQGYLLGNYYYDKKPENGKRYTIVMCYTLGSNNTNILVYQDSYMQLAARFVTKGDKIIESKSFIFNPVRDSEDMGFYQSPEGIYGSKVHWAVLVEGNKGPSGWVPSLFDQEAQAKEIAAAEAALAETKANAYADGIVTEAEQNAINEAQARLDALKIGSVNLVSRKMMLAWNEKNKDIAVWGQDADGIYLAINQKLLYENVGGGTSRLDCFLGEGKYKANTQYVFQVEWKLAAQSDGGLSFWVTYTDGTVDGIRLNKDQTSLTRDGFITAKGKTVIKIHSSYMVNTSRSLIYSLALYEGNKVLTEIPVATEDLQGQSNVNLLDNSKFQFGTEGYAPNQTASLNVVNGVLQVRSSQTTSSPGVRLPLVHLKPGVYTVKVNTKGVNIPSHSVSVYKGDMSSSIIGTGYIPVLSTFTEKLLTFAISTEGDYRVLMAWQSPTATAYPAGLDIEYSMLVEGFTPPASYSPSQGDVQKEIDDVNNAVINLGDTINGAFKDGIISEAEAKAIASNINILNAEKADIDAYYNKLYANAYLTGTAKTNLLNAKTAYNTAHEKLINSINTAIADGKTTATEKADVDAKFTTYNNALSAYQTRVGEADKAIQDQIKALAEQDATNKVDNIQIGARNLFLNSGSEVTNGSHLTKKYNTSVDILPSKKYTVVIRGTTTGGQKLGVWFNRGSDNGGYFPVNMNDEVAFIHVTSPASITESYKRQINFYNHPFSGSAANPATIKWACLYEGHVKPPLDWVQAPEDVEEKINEINSRLSEWASDGYISPQEKTALRQQKSDIQAEEKEIEANANRYGISLASYMSAYNAAISALTKYTATSPENIPVGSDYNNIAAYYTARQTILNSIAAAAKAQADKATGAIGMEGGMMLYKDPEFKVGRNRTTTYGAQNGGGTVVINRIRKSTGRDASNSFSAAMATHVKNEASGSPYSGSDWCLHIKAYGGTSPSHLGGFSFSNPSRANAVFIVKVSAKIPVGYTLKNAHNSHGTGFKQEFLTPMAGTGKYKTYIFKETCGSTGTFSTVNHLYLSGPVKTGSDPLDENPDNRPLEWFVDYATVMDQTADGYTDIEIVTKDSFAEQLGFTDFEALKANAVKPGNGPLIEAGLINTKLLTAEALLAVDGFVDKLRTNILTAYSIKANMLSVAGFTFQDNQIYGGSDYGVGPGVKITSKDAERSFKAYKDASNYISMFYNSASDWGLKGVVGGNSVFQLGNPSGGGTFIGPFNFTKTQLMSSSDVVIGSGTYKQGFTLEDKKMSFNRAAGSIFQRMIEIGIANSTYGSETLLAVVGGDIWHQGVVTTPKSDGGYDSRSCRFYTSDIHMRGIMKMYDDATITDYDGNILIKNGKFCAPVKSTSFYGTSMTFAPSAMIYGINTIGSANVNVRIASGIPGQILVLMNYAGKSFNIVKSNGTLVTRVPAEKSAILYSDGSDWAGLMIGDFYTT